MDLSFQEKSAWGLLIGIGIVSHFYFPAAFDIADSAPHGGTATDERDKLFNLKSERNAGFVLGIGLFWLVGHIIATHTISDKVPIGALSIAVWVLFALTVSEVAKLISQIWYYRVGS